MNEKNETSSPGPSKKPADISRQELRRILSAPHPYVINTRG